MVTNNFVYINQNYYSALKEMMDKSQVKRLDSSFEPKW